MPEFLLASDCAHPYDVDANVVIAEDVEQEVGGDETGHAGWIGVGFECHAKEFAPQKSWFSLECRCPLYTLHRDITGSGEGCSSGSVLCMRVAEDHSHAAEWL